MLLPRDFTPLLTGIAFDLRLCRSAPPSCRQHMVAFATVTLACGSNVIVTRNLKLRTALHFEQNKRIGLKTQIQMIPIQVLLGRGAQGRSGVHAFHLFLCWIKRAAQGFVRRQGVGMLIVHSAQVKRALLGTPLIVKRILFWVPGALSGSTRFQTATTSVPSLRFVTMTFELEFGIRCSPSLCSRAKS